MALTRPGRAHGVLASLRQRDRAARYGVIVKLTPPVPATFDHGPQPASLPPLQIWPAGHARAMPLYSVA